MMNNLKTRPEDLPFVVLNGNDNASPVKHDHAPAEPRSMAQCPKCHSGILEYNGMLNLQCSECGYTVGGCFT